MIETASCLFLVVSALGAYTFALYTEDGLGWVSITGNQSWVYWHKFCLFDTRWFILLDAFHALSENCLSFSLAPAWMLIGAPPIHLWGGPRWRWESSLPSETLFFPRVHSAHRKTQGSPRSLQRLWALGRASPCGFSCTDAVRVGKSSTLKETLSFPWASTWWWWEFSAVDSRFYCLSCLLVGCGW